MATTVPIRIEQIAAVILAGGKSSRMGRNKAWLEVDGQSLLARQVQRAREAGAAEVFISGRADADYPGLGCPVLHDNFPDAGPLTGIERALAATTLPLLLVLAVDLPHLTVALLKDLCLRSRENRGVIPRLSGLVEPLAALYPRVAQPLAETLLRSGRYAVTDFAEACVQSGLAEYYDIPSGYARCFENWNSPSDLKT